MIELKTPKGMEHQCKALIQVFMYAQSESMLATLRKHARCLPGITPWLVLGIGAGLGNLHLFAVSLPALESFKKHLEAKVDPLVKLPLLLLSPLSSSVANAESVCMEEVLRSKSLMNPYTSTAGLANFVQLCSFIGRPASTWAGVGGMGAEREAEMARLLDIGSNDVDAQWLVLGGINDLPFEFRPP
ncbi:hypothetical protein BCR44DRAFT_1504601 [Catenaria anguillulae PL171]|uniref:Uncharacterized protein n=1 Tax=Catenaria anguillulae PL171 TaxID=765915 RepID=A0A1Y2H601_9FUNG|nr:hypothetical protein BCR44DRAFT_1504601 [Catenaria anguillulae PL171]